MVEVDLARARPVVVVGGGARAVALALRLSAPAGGGGGGSGGGGHGVVAAPGGRWLDGWEGEAPGAGAEALRAALPLVSMLGGDPLELQRWAERRGREAEIALGAPGFVGNPTRALAGDFLRRMMKRREKQPALLPLDIWDSAVQEVARVEPQEAMRLGLGGGPLLRVQFDDGGSVLTRALVVAEPAAAPILPDWARHLRKSVPVDASAAEDEARAVGSVTTWGELRRSKVWPDVRGRRICVVGGGTAAARLVLAAAEGGVSNITIVARRPLLAREFECDVGWIGSKLRQDFMRCPDPAGRLRAARAARGQGTMPSALLARLKELAGGSKPVLQIKEVCEVSSATWEGDCASIALTTHFRGLGGQMESSTEQQIFDFVWVATGDAFDASREPLLAKLQELSPCAVVGGYPCLGPGLSWPGLPAFVMGRGALLSVGPGARTLFTASEEAELVVRALNTLWSQPPEEAGLQGVLHGLEAASLSSSPQSPSPGTDEPLDDALPWRPALEKAALKDHSRLNDDFVPPSACRQAIRNFSWVDDEYEVQLRVPIPAGVLPQNVQGHILEDGLELLAVEEPEGDEPVAYHLHIPKLYKPVIVGKSRWRYSEKKGRAYFYLRKFDNHAWPLLKG